MRRSSVYDYPVSRESSVTMPGWPTSAPPPPPPPHPHARPHPFHQGYPSYGGGGGPPSPQMPKYMQPFYELSNVWNLVLSLELCLLDLE